MAYKLLPEESKQASLGLESAYRLPLQAAVGAGAAIPGLAGNIGELLNVGAKPIAEAITGKEGSPYEETTLGKILPTTKTHIKNLEESIPFLKPKNKAEQFVRDFSTDAIELFSPGKVFKMGKYALSPLRSLGISLAANTGGEATEQFTGDKSKGEIVKRGLMLGLSLFNRTSAKKITSDLYSQANQSLPQAAATSGNILTKGLDTLENKILQGRPVGNVAPTEKFVLDQINKFRQLIENGQVNMRALVAQKRSFNEDLQNNLFNIPNRGDRARAKELAKQITHSVTETMKDYGKANGKWWQLQSSADKAHGAIAQSNFISRKLEQFMKGRPEALAHIFGIGLPAGLSFASGPIAALSTGGYLATKLMTRVMRSPVLRKHYAKVTGAAAAGNAKKIEKELDEFQDEINKHEMKGKQKYKLLSQ